MKQKIIEKISRENSNGLFHINISLIFFYHPEVYDGLKCMISLDVSPNQETLREYVVPAILNASFKKQPFEVTLQKLSVYTGIPIGMIAPAALHHLLSIGDIENAAKFGKSRI